MTGNRYNYKKAKELISTILDKPKMQMRDMRVNDTSIGHVAAAIIDRGQVVMSALVFNGYSEDGHKMEPNGLCVVKETAPDSLYNEASLDDVINDSLGEFNKMMHGEFIKLGITLV